MERITAFRFRGTIYETKEAAIKEIDKRIGEILTRHAHRLVQIDKYSPTLDYLEANIDDFHEVKLLMEDKKIVDDD